MTTQCKLAKSVFVVLMVLGCVLSALGSCSKGSKAGATNAQSAAGDALAAVPIGLGAFEKALAREEQVEGSLVRGSVDLSSSTITYYSQAAVSTSSSFLAPEDGPMEIVDYSPV
ncbi:MAG TPA: hypothetical protein PLC54_08145, partial [Spirochaetales bacterium]|nr:hypothetical protein [Spirochaetales bacterium]